MKPTPNLPYFHRFKRLGEWLGDIYIFFLNKLNLQPQVLAINYVQANCPKKDKWKIFHAVINGI